MYNLYLSGNLKKNSKLPMSEFFGKKPSIGCYVSTTYI